METRTLLLIGRTGNGKSTICNVISGTNDFEEGEFGVSQTKDHLKKEYIIDGVKYIIVDTIGIGDTKLSIQEVLYKLADACHSIREGINQVLFVTAGRFTEEEKLCYNILTSVIFNQEIVKHTTIVRTKFSKFRNSDFCNTDKTLMANENQEMRMIINNCNKVLHVNNLSEDDDPSLNARTDSRIKLLTHLHTCREIYRPKELDQLNDKIANYMTDAERAQAKLDEIAKQLQESVNINKALQEQLTREKDQYEKSLEEAKKRVAEATGGQLRERSPGIWEVVRKSFRKCSIQ